MLLNSALISLFLSTPSARRATSCFLRTRKCAGISIHALCEEGDERSKPRAESPGLISIHALCEEGDRDSETNGSKTIKFLSTPSARRATYAKGQLPVAGRFLSTPSARRATAIDDVLALFEVLFLSTPSARRATSR